MELKSVRAEQPPPSFAQFLERASQQYITKKEACRKKYLREQRAGVEKKNLPGTQMHPSTRTCYF